MCRGQVDVVAPQHVFDKHQVEGLFVVGVAASGGVAQVADSLGGGHEEGACPAGGVTDTKRSSGVRVGPVGVPLP